MTSRTDPTLIAPKNDRPLSVNESLLSLIDASAEKIRKNVQLVTDGDDRPIGSVNNGSQLSVLTRVTIDPTSDDEVLECEGFCLGLVTESNSKIFEDNTFNFPRNKDPGIEEYMCIVEVDD